MRGRGLHGLDNEAGGHRVQRVPANDRLKRVHTSTVTVAVLAPSAPSSTDVALDPSDLEVEWFSGTGAGGQHRNKKRTSCRVRHVPTGVVETRQGRDREANRRDATEALRASVAAARRGSVDRATADLRSRQVGSGMRGDKIVTIRFKDDRAVHHGTGRSTTASRYMRGFVDDTWSDARPPSPTGRQ